MLKSGARLKKGGIRFGYKIKDPKRWGGVEFDNNNNVISIEEKQINPKAEYAVTGLYFYDNKVVEIAKNIKPSNRGELEITCINNAYLKNNELKLDLLGKGFTWLDTGTVDSILEASLFVQSIQMRQWHIIAYIKDMPFLHVVSRQQSLEQIHKKYHEDIM